MTPEQRREAFISDIVEVCKRHRVMLEDELQLDTGSGITFSEQKPDEQGLSFCVEIEDIESAVREAVWPIVHGEGE